VKTFHSTEEVRLETGRTCSLLHRMKNSIEFLMSGTGKDKSHSYTNIQRPAHDACNSYDKLMDTHKHHPVFKYGTDKQIPFQFIAYKT